MRRQLYLTTIAALLVLPAVSFAQEQQSGQSTQQSQQQAKQQAQTQAPQKQSLAEAARKVREKEKAAPKAAMVFTNDNIPTSGGGVSVVGAQPAPAKESGKESTAESNAAAPKNNDEAMWRKKFADARQKVAQDEQELSIMQRELGELNLQYYPDPTKALKQSVDRSDIIKKTNAIAAKQKELEADKQALSTLEDQLRAAGGDPGWARP